MKFTDKLPVVLLLSSITMVIAQDTKSHLQMKIIRQQKDCQHALNAIRQNHDVPNLKWDDQLAFQAEEWALSSALRQKMATDPSARGVGEIVYRSFGYKNAPPVPCSRAIFSWYHEIKHFSYVNPKWTYHNGGFIQLVYDAEYSFGMGVVHYLGNTYIVGRFSKWMSQGDSELKLKIKKPTKVLTKADVEMANPPRPMVQIVQVPANGGYTDYFKTGTCSVKCGQGTVEARRYCVRQKTQHALTFCTQSKTKRLECQGGDTNCTPSCADKHADCQAYADRGYCKNDKYQVWMKLNCPLSCGYCPCKDIHKDCAAYAEQKRYCTNQKYQEWMKVNCKNSCALCQPACEDQHKDCPGYANDKQYCKEHSKYHQWMKKNCRKACSFCE